jgi:MFS family permease
LFSWVFAGFLLTQTATTVVFGKLADVYGRRPVMLTGIAIFLLGSTLCGLAWSMPALVGFRLLQGIGAGAIQPICLTVVGDLYTVQERGRIQAYLASVWGVSSVVGPLAGGLIIQHLSWAWIFWINLPVGAAAAAGFVAFLHDRPTAAKPDLDAAGAALFAVAVAALMVALTKIGTAQATQAVLAGLVFLASTLLFIRQEQLAADPMVALRLWARRPIATTNAATLLSGMAVIGLTAFLPMYVQGVLNRSALVAGFALTIMVLGWPIGSIIAARNFTRFGLRATMLVGAALMPAGALAFAALGPDSSLLLADFGSLVMGLGMGFLSTSAVVIIQESVGWAERGTATASNIFSRNLGSTLGAAALGGIVNISLARHSEQVGGVTYEQIRHLLDHPGALPADPSVGTALGQSLHLTFLVVFVLALATLLLAMLVPAIPLARRPLPATGD